MILKNKALQIFDFLAAPTEKLYERAARFHLRGLSEAMAGTTPYTGPHIFTLRYFPEVAAALGDKAVNSDLLRPSLQVEPMAALRLMLSNYEAYAPKLESLVLTSAEATYYLLKEAKEKKLTLAQPPEAYLITLLKDPFWALRLYGDTNDESLLARCLQVAKAGKDKEAGAAYLHLYFNVDEDPTDYVDILSNSSMYSYLASRHFYDRGIEFKYLNLKNLTPRWAYHFITDGFLDNEEGLIESMLSEPEWLVEYLVESERYKDLAYTGALVEKAMQKAHPNLITIYLKLWWERCQNHVKKTTSAKTPAKAS